MVEKCYRKKVDVLQQLQRKKSVKYKYMKLKMEEDERSEEINEFLEDSWGFIPSCKTNG